MGSKWPKTSKICPKTRIIGEILSKFFLVQALGTYTMTIWSGPSLTKPRPGSGGLKKCLKGLKMTKNKQNMSQNKNYWWVTFKNFLRIGSRDINNDNLIRPPASNSLGLGQGGSNRARRSSKWPKTSKIYPKSRIIGGLLSRFFLVQALETYTMTIWSKLRIFGFFGSSWDF